MYSAQCWNYGNLLPNSVDIAENYSYYHFKMWKSTIKSDHTQKVSVKSTLLVTTLVKILIWRKKCWFCHQTRDHVLCHTLWKFRNFAATILSQKFRAINFLLKKFTLNWFDEEICQWISRFSQWGNLRIFPSRFFAKISSN